MVSVKINVKPVIQELRRIQGAVSNFAGLFQKLRYEFLIKRINEIFSSNGKGTWLPTKRTNPILRDTLRLMRSYTQAGAPGNINLETETKLTWGTDVFYAQFHEYGTSRLPARQVLGLLDTSEIQKIAYEWVEEIINA